MVLVLRLVGPSLDTVRKRRRGIRGDIGAEEIERRREPEVEVALEQRKIYRARPAYSPGILAPDLLHHLERPLHDATQAGLADEHVMRFLGQHETAGASERVESRLGQALELELAVAIGDVSEAKEAQPIGHRLVERAEDARLVGVAGMAREEFFRFLASVAAEVRVE